MPRSAQVMRCLALSGSLRMEPSRSSTGRTAFGSLSGKDKRSPAAADEVDEDVHGVSLEHGTFLLGFPYGFQQDEGVARMDS